MYSYPIVIEVKRFILAHIEANPRYRRVAGCKPCAGILRLQLQPNSPNYVRVTGLPRSASSLDPGTIIVSFRSGPIETDPISTPVRSSRNAK